MVTRNFSWFIVFAYLILFSSLKIHFCFGADTISTGKPLSGDQTIISAAGQFELGFFKPGNSSYYYIGIWYKNVSLQTVVWVANRDYPLTDKYSSELKITAGNLILVNKAHIPVWSTNLKSNTNSYSTTAVLLDDGNLIVRQDGPYSSGTVLWQRFDHDLTNAFLPQIKFGLINRRTNKTNSLTSWKNSDDPAPGIFSMEFDPAGNGSYFLSWNRSVRYWSTGMWDGYKFPAIPDIGRNYKDTSIQHYFRYITNKNESYFTYWVQNVSFISRLVLDFSGQIKQLTWLESAQKWYLFWTRPEKQCDVHALCGPFGTCNEMGEDFCGCLPGFTPSSPKDWNLSDWSGGCKRNARLKCGDNAVNGKEDRFSSAPNMRLPLNQQSLATGSVASPRECEVACLSNCSCTAYAYGSTGCSIWIGNLLHLQKLSVDDHRGRTLYIRLAAAEFPSNSNSEGKVIGVVVGSVTGGVFLLGLVLVVRSRRSRIGATKLVDGSLVSFSYKDLHNATKNFSEKLGGGGFGCVFKGIMPDSTVIAVKKLESVSQGEKQFRSEVSTNGTIQHVNLIQLRGFCSEGNQKLLVYDYMPNRSLDTHLFQGKDSQALGWERRYQIALGTARGLAYLHEKCRDCIIHCDVKPENILLDAEFCPKVADFGLAKLLGRDFSRVLTTIRGTRGYLAPEWILGLPITPKADVFSYGMMLFEFVSGRRNSEQSEDGKIPYFPIWTASQVAEGVDVFCLLDHRLEGRADVVELTRVCRVACWCIQDNETDRPSMGQIVRILEGVVDVNLAPVPRSLEALVNKQEVMVFFNESSQARNNASASFSLAKSIPSSIS